MSLSEDERIELERLRESRKSRETMEGASRRALGLAFLYVYIPWFAQLFGISIILDRSFWSIIYYVGVVVCFVSGFLSSYYGPFKKEEEKVNDVGF